MERGAEETKKHPKTVLQKNMVNTNLPNLSFV